MPKKELEVDGGVAKSRQNRIAGRILLHARQSADMNQTDFAASIAKRLGIPSFGQPALSGWETSIRQVPAAAIIAAAEIVRAHGFDLTDAINAEIGPATVPQAAKLAVALEAMADALKGEASEQVRAAADSLRRRGK
jgi:transcriptional regulator with XRE-family HTH domain